jgi:Xaa-Pro aminopeptidase
VGRTVEFLRSFDVEGDVLVVRRGELLTAGRVRAEVNRFIAEEGMEDPDGIILSIGRDAGVPHTKGRGDAVVELGKTIILDIFPRERGGGYFFDMTRTFCLGYAPPEVEKAYQDVYDCVAMLESSYAVGEQAGHYQRLACDFLASRGHPTIAADPTTESGYVHGLGHGVGLAIHEEPFFSDDPTNTAVVQAGHVFSCEPGLYYPDRGYGVRIEDLLWVDGQGNVCNLSGFPKDLVIEV